MNDYTVYIHINKINGMKYVGITHQDISVRWQAGGNGYRKQEHFWRAIKKYGWDNFEHEIVASGLSHEDACKLEIELIERHQTRDNTKGYNKSSGGESGAKGVKKNEKQREASSKMLSEKWHDPIFREASRQRTIAMNKTEAMRKKRSEASRGRIMSDESRKKISEAKRGKKLGPFTSEHIAKIKAHHGGGLEKKEVLCVETQKRYASINDAARETGINKKQISGCCRGQRHYNTAGGLHWEFA